MKIELTSEEVKQAVLEYVARRAPDVPLNTVRAANYGYITDVVVSYEQPEMPNAAQ